MPSWVSRSGAMSGLRSGGVREAGRGILSRLVGGREARRDGDGDARASRAVGVAVEGRAVYRVRRDRPGAEERMIEAMVEACPRCGERHEEVVLRHFVQRPIVTPIRTWTFWGMCPKTGEPMILALEEG